MIKKRKSRLPLFLFIILLLLVTFNIYFIWFKETPKFIALNKKEAKEYGVYCVGEERPDSCYWFDEEGIILKEAKTIVEEFILKVEEISNYKPIFGKSFIQLELFKNLIPILEFFKTRELTADNITLKRKDQELEISIYQESTGLKTKVILSLRFDPKNNLAGPSVFLHKYKLKNLDYIDLRVENKIFYK